MHCGALRHYESQHHLVNKYTNIGVEKQCLFILGLITGASFAGGQTMLLCLAHKDYAAMK